MSGPGPEPSPSRVKTVLRRSPKPKRTRTRRVCTRIPYSIAHLLTQSEGNIATGSVKSDEWIKILAVHLAAEPDFAKWMQNPQTVESILLRKEWLAAVYLPGRSKYNRFEVS